MVRSNTWVATIAAVAMLAGCGGEDSTGASVQPLVAAGGFTAAIDNGEFAVDYTGATVEVEMQHKINKSGQYACIPAVTMKITPAGAAADDRSCGLDLEFGADFNGELKLKKAKFYAKSAIFQDGVPIMTFPCASWTTEPAKGEVAYESVEGAEGYLQMKPLEQPQAGMANAVISNANFAPKGKVEMKFKGRKFVLDLNTINVTGGAKSLGSETLDCAQKYQPLPYLELKDVNPGSPLYNQTYSLEEFKGKYVAVLMGAGWCASCLSQAHYLEKIKSDFEAQGRKDIAMVVINAASASSPANQDKMCKCSKSPCPAPGKHLSYTVFQGTGEYDWGTLIDPKTGQNGKKNDCFIYAPDGRFIFKHVGKGTVNLGQFDTEVRDALNTKVEDIP